MAAISIQLMIHNNTHAGITLKHWMNDKMVEIMWDKELKTDSHHLAIHSFLIPWRWCYWSESRPPCTCVRRCSLSVTPVGSWSVCACSGWRSQRGWSPPHRSWWRGRAGWSPCPARWSWSGVESWTHRSRGSRSPRSARRGCWERSPSFPAPRCVKPGGTDLKTAAAPGPLSRSHSPGTLAGGRAAQFRLPPSRARQGETEKRSISPRYLSVIISDQIDDTSAVQPWARWVCAMSYFGRITPSFHLGVWY